MGKRCGVGPDICPGNGVTGPVESRQEEVHGKQVVIPIESRQRVPEKVGSGPHRIEWFP